MHPRTPRGGDRFHERNDQLDLAADFAAANHARYAPAGLRAIPSIAYRLALAAIVLIFWKG